MIAVARSALMPGDLGEPFAGGQDGRVGAGVGRWDAGGGDAPGAGHGGELGADLVLERADLAVEAVDEAEQGADEPDVVLAGHHALQGRADAVAAALDAGVRERGEPAGVALAAGDRLQDAAGGLVAGHVADCR
jgi:hypothetical protein